METVLASFARFFGQTSIHDADDTRNWKKASEKGTRDNTVYHIRITNGTFDLPFKVERDILFE